MASIKRGDLIFSVLFGVAILMAIIIGFGSAAVADPAGFVAAIFIGALILIFTGVASWKIIVSVFAGAYFMGYIHYCS